MQISGVEKLNSKHILFDLYNLCVYCLQFKKNFVIYVNLYCLTYPPKPPPPPPPQKKKKYSFSFGLDIQVCIANEFLCLVCCGLMPPKLSTHTLQ